MRGSALLPILLSAVAPATPPGAADLNLARAVLKQLVELDTSHTAGETTSAAEAVAARLREAGLPPAHIQGVGPPAHKKNLVARLHRPGTPPPLLLPAPLPL